MGPIAVPFLWIVASVIFAIQTPGKVFDMAFLYGIVPSAVTALAAVATLGLLMVERRRRESVTRLLRDARELNRRLRDGSASGVCTVDAHGRILHWNPALERFTGIPRRHARGSDLLQYPGFTDARHAESLRLALHGVETASHPRADLAGAHTGQLHAYYAPVRNGRGQVSGALVIVTIQGAATTRDNHSLRVSASAA